MRYQASLPVRLDLSQPLGTLARLAALILSLEAALARGDDLRGLEN